MSGAYDCKHIKPTRGQLYYPVYSRLCHASSFHLISWECKDSFKLFYALSYPDFPTLFSQCCCAVPARSCCSPCWMWGRESQKKDLCMGKKCYKPLTKMLRLAICYIKCTRASNNSNNQRRSSRRWPANQSQNVHWL